MVVSQSTMGAELTFTIVAEGHLGLAEANGVFALADAIELFKLGLLHILLTLTAARWWLARL